MKELKVPNMHCGMCVERISKALNAEGIAFEISLENKTVTVDEAAVAAVTETLDDLGFDVE